MERKTFEIDKTMRDIFNNLGDAVYFVDGQGVILFINHAAERLDGFTLAEVKGKTVMETYHLSAAESPLLRVVCSHEPLLEHFFRYSINDQDVYQICNTFPVALDDGYWGAFSIQRDVTQLKKTIDHNIELQKQLFQVKTGDDQKEHGSNIYTFDDIIGDHKSLKQCKLMAYNAAKGDSSVMLAGLTGTGKELFAQSIHSASRRAGKPFLAINCAAIPESLIEGILFGTVKGAYTGAVDRKGLFEEADGGTIFLDETNSMPLASQAKLLRVLEEKYVQPLGGRNQIRVDTRIISSCNQYPQDVLRSKQIREDLFYRLSVVNILIPSLQERKSDIFLLAHHFIAKYNERYGKRVLCMEDDITKFFLDYAWPGNVRQLKHCVEGAMNLVGNDETAIKKQHLPFYLMGEEPAKEPRFYQDFQNFDEAPAALAKPLPAVPKPAPATPPQNVLAEIKAAECERIIAALRAADGNVSKAARQLKMSRQTLVYRMKKYQIG